MLLSDWYGDQGSAGSSGVTSCGGVALGFNLNGIHLELSFRAAIAENEKRGPLLLIFFTLQLLCGRSWSSK